MCTAMPWGLLAGVGTRPFTEKSTGALFRSVVWGVAERAGVTRTKHCSCHNGGGKIVPGEVCPCCPLLAKELVVGQPAFPGVFSGLLNDNLGICRHVLGCWAVSGCGHVAQEAEDPGEGVCDGTELKQGLGSVDTQRLAQFLELLC